jgi:CRP-like cAMP-binding protein
MLYNCRRSATVIASNYCTLARLSPVEFKNITSKYPSYLKHLKEQVYLYDDPIKLFLEEQIKRIPYLRNVEIDTFHDVLFNFNQETCDKGTYIFREGDRSAAVFIVKSGILEILVRVEGFEIAIERLYRGSIINHNAFLIGDICDISGRCIDTQTIFFLNFEKINQIRMKHPELSNQIDKQRASVSGKENPYIIDYIMGRKVLRTKRSIALEEKRSMLTCRLKNLILLFLSRVKAKKKKASFKEVLSGIIEKKKADMQLARKMRMVPGLTQADMEQV